MDMFLHQVLGGLATGGIYASLALAMVMIYQSTHHVNFAQGEMAMFSTFVAWMLMQAGMPYWGAFAATVLLSFLLGAVVEVCVIRPLRHAPVLSVVTVFVGLLVLFQALAGWLFGYTVKEFPSPFVDSTWRVGNYISPHQLGATAVTLVMMGLLYGFLRWTTVGLSMRAVAQNPISAALSGIRVKRMLMLGWGLAAAIGAVAGVMVAPVVFLDPHMMTGVLIYAFAAALIGGIDNPAGAVGGGFLVGVMENLIGTYLIGSDLKLSVALVFIVAVLIVRPSGLFGRATVTKV